MYTVELSQRSQKFLEKLDEQIKRRIEDRLKKLGETPYLLMQNSSQETKKKKSSATE